MQDEFNYDNSILGPYPDDDEGDSDQQEDTWSQVFNVFDKKQRDKHPVEVEDEDKENDEPNRTPSTVEAQATSDKAVQQRYLY